MKSREGEHKSDAYRLHHVYSRDVIIALRQWVILGSTGKMSTF